MTPEKIISRAEMLKRKNHRLSLALRLKSVPEARKFIREQGMVLWSGKAELPNLLDASLGRIANGKERTAGKPAENCRQWRRQLLREPEFIDCPFFQKMPTVIHYDVWPYITVISRRNRETAGKSMQLSKEARRLLTVVEREGKMSSEELRKSARLSGSSDLRPFQRALRELQNGLIVVGREHSQSGNSASEVLDLWENSVPRSVLSRAEHMESEEALLKLLQATINGCVLAPEKRIRKWFDWADEHCRNEILKLLQSKKFLRVDYGKDAWVVTRKVLA